MEYQNESCIEGSHVSSGYMDFPVVIVGGGIAGVSCLQQLALSAPEKDVTLISASSLVTATTNVKVLTKTLTQFDVEERKMDWLETIHPKVKVIHAKVMSLDPVLSRVHLASTAPVHYSRLCICTGASPKGLPGVPGAATNPNVIGVRDASTAAELRRRVASSRCILIAGNGGIASEVAYGLCGVNVVWAVRDCHINAAFIDPGAATYLEANLKSKAHARRNSPERDVRNDANNPSNPEWKIIRTKMTKEDDSNRDGDVFGSALGPDWQKSFPLHGAARDSGSLHIEYSCEISSILTPEEVMAKGLHPAELFASGVRKGNEEGSLHGGQESGGIGVPIDHQASDRVWPVYAILTNGKCIGCDLVVAATGVIPNSAPFLNIQGAPTSCSMDGNGLMVDLRMRTTADRVFAAGDVATAAWPNRSKHWHQMRLWTQARMMGFHAGRCIAASLHREGMAISRGMMTQTEEKAASSGLKSVSDEVGTSSNVMFPTLNVHWKEDDYMVPMDDDESMYDFGFELFSHVTKFFGCRTILLGLFNGQGLGRDYEVLLRVGGGEYVKVIVGRDGRVAGAVLIGETDLEETLENLILSGLDVSAYGEDLLHPGVDIEDYFD